MQFAATIIIEADTLKTALLRIPDDLGEVVSVTPRPPSTPKPQGISLPSVPTNMRTGLPIDQK